MDSVGFDCLLSPNFPDLGTFGINISIKKKEILKYDDKPEELTIFAVIFKKKICIYFI